MIKHVPSTIIVLAEAGNSQDKDKQSSPITGLASQWSPGLLNGLVNESSRRSCRYTKVSGLVNTL